MQVTYRGAAKVKTVKKIREKLYRLFRLNNRPVVKVYDGYGDSQTLTVFGHVLGLSPMARKTYRQNWVVNLFSMLRMFMVRPLKGAELSMEWQGETLKTESQDNGYFRFEWVPNREQQPGWYTVKVLLHPKRNISPEIIGEGNLHIPFPSRYIFISDIDDTFLISHSSNLRKRLYVLFTKNARTRRPFDGVVKHYQLMATAIKNENEKNSFFYVSSSEWNLYDLVTEFSRRYELPRGVYLLNQLKTFSEVLKTGQNKHAGKFTRIVRIIETYPKMHFVLFGDDTQEDPNIYHSVATHFPGNIYSVYIRRINPGNYERTQETVKKIEAAGVHCCYFFHSKDAIEHSIKIGLGEPEALQGTL